MLRGIPLLKPYVSLHHNELDSLKRYTCKSIQMALKRGLRRKKMNPITFIVASLTVTSNSLLHFNSLNKKVSC